MSDNHIKAVETESEAYKTLGNAKVTLWDIDNDELTERENNRLRTIIGKVDELEGIMAGRLAGEQ